MIRFNDRFRYTNAPKSSKDFSHIGKVLEKKVEIALVSKIKDRVTSALKQKKIQNASFEITGAKQLVRIALKNCSEKDKTTIEQVLNEDFK